MSKGFRIALIVVAAVCAVYFLGGYYFQMPGPQLANLERPVLVLSSLDGLPVDAQGQPAAGPAGAAGTEDATVRRTTTRRPTAPAAAPTNRMSAEERRELAKERRLKRLEAARQRRDAASSAPGSPQTSRATAARRSPARPGGIGKSAGPVRRPDMLDTTGSQEETGELVDEMIEQQLLEEELSREADESGEVPPEGEYPEGEDGQPTDEEME